MNLVSYLLGIIKGTNNKHEERNVEISEGNYNENIERDFIQVINQSSAKIPPPTGFPQNIPTSRTNKFIGRQTQLEALHQQLQDSNKVTIAHLEGMGGIGKTELAIQYSLKHLQQNSYPGGICWIRCREEDIGLQIVNFTRYKLGLNLPENLETIDHQVKWLWERWRKGNKLIVLDDVKNYSDIQPYLPPLSSEFKVLITTRLKLDLDNPLFLNVLTESEALELLRQLVGSQKVNQELATATELGQRLGYLPLALQLVGRYVKKRGISLAEELQSLEKKGLLSHPSLEIPQNDPAWTANINLGAAAAFELSWQELSKSAQELGCLLSLFALAPIPWSLVESSAVEQSKEELEDARVELVNLHLLQSDGNYQLHQLIQEFFREKQNKLKKADEQKRNFCRVIVEKAREIQQTITLSDINNLNPFIPHIAETATVYQDWLNDEDLIVPFKKLGNFYNSQGAYTQALPWYEQSISVTRKRLGEEDCDVATSLNELGLLYYDQGRYSEAEPLYLQALELYKKLLGESHSYVATSLNNLGLLYYDQGRYSEAEPLYLQALELYKKLLGESHPDVAQSLNNLAALYDSQGKYSEAEPLYLQALELRKKLLGESHPDVAQSLNNLAALYKSQGRYSEAEPLFLQALELKKKLLGESHPYVATSLHWLALLYKSQRKYNQAEPLYQKALAIYEKTLGANHPHTIACQNNYEIFKQAKNNN